MACRINHVHWLTTNIHVSVIVKQIGWLRHEGIRREELAAIGVVVAGVEVHQAAAVEFLASELVVGGQGAAAAVATRPVIALIIVIGAAAGGDKRRAAEVSPRK